MYRLAHASANSGTDQRSDPIPNIEALNVGANDTFNCTADYIYSHRCGHGSSHCCPIDRNADRGDNTRTHCDGHTGPYFNGNIGAFGFGDRSAYCCRYRCSDDSNGNSNDCTNNDRS